MDQKPVRILCKAKEWGVVGAAPIHNNVAAGNLANRNIRLISADYTSNTLQIFLSVKQLNKATLAAIAI